MMMSEEQPDYIAYLLRLWRTGGQAGGAWRASIEDPHTGERRGFASLEALFAFLREQVGMPSVSDRNGGIDLRQNPG